METNRHTLIALTPARVGALTTLAIFLKGMIAHHAPSLMVWLTSPLV